MPLKLFHNFEAEGIQWNWLYKVSKYETPQKQNKGQKPNYHLNRWRKCHWETPSSLYDKKP
jgi:hypothetical protein